MQKSQPSDTIINEMIQVTRKDAKESAESLLRRLNRKVQQAGTVAKVKQAQYFEKGMSKTVRRERAIVRAHRKAEKVKKIKLGLR